MHLANILANFTDPNEEKCPLSTKSLLLNFTGLQLLKK